MRFKRVSESEICRIIQNLKSKSSSGVDSISNVLLKKLVSVIKGPLCVIFNKSLSSGIFPDLMKLAKVVPLHKSGDTNLPDNYCPISLLPVLSKVLEKVVYACMERHLNENDILYCRQFGFCKRHSTVDAVANFVGDILNCFEGNQFVLAVFVDLRKAFDSMSHELLLKKLQCIGVEDTELEWLKNYLSCRKQCISIGKVLSELSLLEVAVAQGSLLGVLLFQLFINDLPSCLRFGTSILYADDTTIFLS